MNMTVPADRTSQYAFNGLFLRRFWRLQRVFFPAVLSANSGFFLLLLLTSGLEQYLAYEVGIIAGQFFGVLGEKDLERFKTICIKNIVLVLSIAFTKSARVYSTRLLTVGWRKTLCHLLHKLYLAQNNHYRLNVLEQTVDNPDQRMTSDVSSLVESYSSIIALLVVVPFTTAYYAWNAYTRAGWIGPTGMFAIFLVSTAINKFLMRPVIQITVQKERREGDLRFKQMQIRNNGESLAFHGSSSIELSKVNNKLSDVCRVQQSLYNRNFIIDISVNLFAYLGAIASYLVISVPIFAGVYDDLTGPELSQIISENAFVCIYLVFQFSQLVEITSTVAGLAGSTHRVSELAEILTQYQKEEKEGGPAASPPDSPPACVVVEKALLDSVDSDMLLEIEYLTLGAPKSTDFLIDSLNLQVVTGQNILVMGPSSAGKTSLLRAIRGLWQPLAGQIRINPQMDDRVFFLPQRPFFTNGSLREQVSYPQEARPAGAPELGLQEEEERILAMFSQAGMTGLVERCGGLDKEPEWNWYDILSPGEQQRLAFIRLLYHRPALAVIDEATSALSEDMEVELYQACLKSGITLLSVGHRRSLLQFHQKVLVLHGKDGSWELKDSQPS